MSSCTAMFTKVITVLTRRDLHISSALKQRSTMTMMRQKSLFFCRQSFCGSTRNTFREEHAVRRGGNLPGAWCEWKTNAASTLPPRLNTLTLGSVNSCVCESPPAGGGRTASNYHNHKARRSLFGGSSREVGKLIQL